ncbi:hemerythrin domain-containing protein [Kitasatospora sp. NPDC052896]|uniref:hemerythrin domain-containing protein n=1 Tax=Kitasatospora sp. NPDC052896 TaxID=3364061 RepID=UPI0037CAC65D
MSSDAIVLLKEEHKEIRQLFRAYRATTEHDHAARGELAEEIVHAVTVYTYVEDEVVYPRVGALLPELEPEIRQGGQEHQLADLLCTEITGLAPASEEFDAKVGVLIETVERHIEREERDWFPRVRAGVGRKDLQEIGTRLLAVRETAPRPHPGPVSDPATGAPESQGR